MYEYITVDAISLISGFWDKDERSEKVYFQCHGKFAADIWMDQLFQEVSSYSVLESESRRRRGPHVVETQTNLCKFKSMGNADL